MFFGRLSSALRTLRFRLMLWSAGVVLFAALVTIVGLREGVRYALLSEIDQILVEDIQEIGLTVHERRDTNLETLQEELDRKARGHRPHGLFVQIELPKSAQFWSSINTPTNMPPRSESLSIVPTTFGRYRFAEQLFHLPNGDEMYVRVGASLDFLARDMARIDRLALLAGGVALILAPITGYWLAGRTTRLLSEFTNTAARLRPSKLDERLPIRNTGDELDSLSGTVNHLLDRIAVYLQQKRDFLANSAHELRSPLAAIRSGAEVALNSGRSIEEYQELLADIIDECSTLEYLVNQLLLLSETESNRVRDQRERVEFDHLLQRSIDMFEPVAETSGIQLVHESFSPVVIEGNRHHLMQLVNNLIDNALKFTPVGGKIVVGLEVNSATRVATLSVDDTGCGIPAEDLPHVFERFYRGDKSRDRHSCTRGTGLGLSICDAVVTAHGGRIHVVSELDRGTRMTVDLPLASQHAPAASQVPEPSVASVAMSAVDAK